MNPNAQDPELFPRLSDEELERLKSHGRELQLNPGDLLFQEGDPIYQFYVVLEGQVKVTKRMGTGEKLLALHEAGEFTGEISMIMGKPASATGRAIGACRVLEIDPDTFKQVLAECSRGAAVILSAMAGRSREAEVLLRQQEKLAALGRLSAGLAHELNNPAAAGQRAAKQLRESIGSIQARLLKLCDQLFPDEQRELVIQIQQAALAHTTQCCRLDPLTQSDREDALTDWLDRHNVANGWKLAPTLVSGGINGDQLDELADSLSPTALTEALNWLSETLTLASLVNEVEQSTNRISELVKAIKSYSYMDQAPIQEVDLHEGLENTLTILHHKLKYDITVNRSYAENLPKIYAYGSELNQVWTNLLDNAAYALKVKLKQYKSESKSFTPTISIRTERLADERILVEIADNGSGIPAEIQSRIFEPFFTTKGVGEGSGLGLDIVHRIVQHHHGDIHITSQPGETKFSICLPIERPD
ncbi:MAG: cyclic nucleotide-binding domain-containing protein [Cyanobacteria bacterium RM1_2_2]|nr:cyclic nucleotide-binding domain-containing protein [Cyanobacteria bacterium RM1_2_2]